MLAHVILDRHSGDYYDQHVLCFRAPEADPDPKYPVDISNIRTVTKLSNQFEFGRKRMLSFPADMTMWVKHEIRPVGF